MSSLDGTIEFMVRCANDENRSSGVYKAVVGLLGDLGDAFGVKMFTVFSQPFVLNLVTEATKDEDMKDIAMWTYKVRQLVHTTYSLIRFTCYDRSWQPSDRRNQYKVK